MEVKESGVEVVRSAIRVKNANAARAEPARPLLGGAGARMLDFASCSPD